jgi:hypothetical protein
MPMSKHRTGLLHLVLWDGKDESGEAQRAGAEVTSGQGDGGTAHHRSAAREGTDPLRDPAGITVDHGHVVRRHAQFISGDLRQRGLEPLTL